MWLWLSIFVIIAMHCIASVATGWCNAIFWQKIPYLGTFDKNVHIWALKNGSLTIGQTISRPYFLGDSITMYTSFFSKSRPRQDGKCGKLYVNCFLKGGSLFQPPVDMQPRGIWERVWANLKVCSSFRIQKACLSNYFCFISRSPIAFLALSDRERTLLPNWCLVYSTDMGGE